MRRARGESGNLHDPALCVVERAARRAGSPGRGAAVRPGPAAVHSEAFAVTRSRFLSTMLALIPRTCAS